MPAHRSRPRPGDTASGCLTCAVPTEHRPGGLVIESHHPGCTYLDGARSRRELDIEFLITHPGAVSLFRGLAPDDHPDLIELGADPPTSAAEARHWTVSVRMIVDGDVIRIGKVYRLDGHRLPGGVIDSAPLAGAR